MHGDERESVHPRHARERADRARNPPAPLARREQRADGERDEESFGVAYVQEVARREDEHEEHAGARDRLFFVESCESVEQKPRGERRERGDEERAEQFVAEDEGEGAHEPRVERVEDYPARLDALGDVAHARDVEVVRRVPTVPDGEPVVEGREALVRRDDVSLRAEEKDERLDRQHQADEARVQ